MGRCLPSSLAEEEREKGRELLVGGREGIREVLCGGRKGQNWFWSFSSLICNSLGFVVDEALYLGFEWIDEF